MSTSAHVSVLIIVSLLVAGCGSSSVEAGSWSGTVVAASPRPAAEADPEAPVARRYAEAVIAAAMAAVELPVYGDHPWDRVAAARVMVAAARTANELARERGITEPDELEGPVTAAADALATHLEPSEANEWLSERRALTMELVEAMTVGVAVLQSRSSRFFEGLDAPDAVCMEARLRVFFGAAWEWREVELNEEATPEQRAAWQAMARGAADLDADPGRLSLPAAGEDAIDGMTQANLVEALQAVEESCAALP